MNSKFFCQNCLVTKTDDDNDDDDSVRRSLLSNYTDYTRADFERAFRMFDKNHDGRLSAHELKKVFNELGIKLDTDEVKRMIRSVDKNGKGTICFTEFVQMMTQPATRESDEYELREAFKCIDLDGNGFISRDELRKAVKKIMSSDKRIGVNDVEEMMNEADQDGNGLIDFDEFVRILVEKRN